MLSPKQRPYALLLLTCTAIYLQTLGFSNTEIDDPKHIFENPIMLSSSWAGFWEIWRSAYFGLYIPVTYTFWFLISRVTLSPIAFHSLNLALHTINGILVFILFQRILKKEAHALVGALFFLCHPLQVESVSWISASKDLLSATFGLGSLLVILSEKQSPTKIMGAGLLFLLSLLSKPSLAFIPLFALIYLIWVDKLSWKECFLRLSLPVLSSALILIFTKSLQPDHPFQSTEKLAHRPMVALDAIGFYLGKSIYPMNLSLDYGRTPISVETKFGLLMVIFFFGILLFKNRKHFPLSAVGICLFLLSLLPTLGLVPFQFQFFSTVADRFIYFGLIGIALIAMELLSKAGRIAIASPILLILGILSFQQATHWENNDKLFSHTLSINAHSPLAHNNWGFSLYHRGQYALAAEHFSKVLETQKQDRGVRRNYAAALIKMGNLAEGQKQFRIASADETSLNANQ